MVSSFAGLPLSTQTLKVWIFVLCIRYYNSLQPSHHRIALQGCHTNPGKDSSFCNTTDRACDYQMIDYWGHTFHKILGTVSDRWSRSGDLLQNLVHQRPRAEVHIGS